MRGIKAVAPGGPSTSSAGHREVRGALRLRRRPRLHRSRRRAGVPLRPRGPPLRLGPQHATVMEPGMVFTIEPMLTLGTHEWDMWEDGWTVVTKDRRRTAQFEHTIVVTRDRRGDPHPPVVPWSDRTGRRSSPGAGHGGVLERCASRRLPPSPRSLPGGPVSAPVLSRPTHGKLIAGVCAGLARRFGLSPNVVRLLFLVSCLLPGRSSSSTSCCGSCCRRTPGLRRELLGGLRPVSRVAAERCSS